MQKMDKQTKKKAILGILAIVFILALGLTFYPVISHLYNERHSSEIHTSYQEQLKQIDNSDILKSKEKAKLYNEALVPGVREEHDAFSIEYIQKALKNYKEQLNLIGNNIMGYVEIPAIDITLPIYHGTDEMTLEFGVGHIVGSSLPIGGESSHCLLTGHSGMASSKMFSDLAELKEGDLFYLEVLDETLAYKIDQIVTVLPEDTEHLQIERGKDYCTLITCTPFGINTHRLLVRGERIPYVEEEKVEVEQMYEDVTNESAWESQYIFGIAVGFGAIILFLIFYCIACSAKRGELNIPFIAKKKEEDKEDENT